MEKVKRAGKKGKAKFESKLEEIQNSQWAGPIATVLKTAAALVTLVPDPGGSVLKAALSLGANALKPGPDIAVDLQGAKKDRGGSVLEAALSHRDVCRLPPS